MTLSLLTCSRNLAVWRYEPPLVQDARHPFTGVEAKAKAANQGRHTRSVPDQGNSAILTRREAMARL